MRTLAPLALMGLLANPLGAQEMTDTEREAFRAEVRAYLLENPEVLMEAIEVLETRQAEAAQQRDVELVKSEAATLFNSATSYVGGNPDGDITVVEFLDYKCGYCKRAHPEVAALITGDTNIRYIIKEFPILGEESALASQYALAVRALEGDDAYFEAHNTLMEFQGTITEANLERLSDALALDHEAIVEKMNSPDVRAIIDENRQLAANLAISGTPSFVFDDQMVRGYVPLNQMQALVSAIRADG